MKKLIPIIILMVAVSGFGQVKKPTLKTTPNPTPIVKNKPTLKVVVEKTNGDRLTGLFVSANSDSVTIEFSESKIKIPFGEIAFLWFNKIPTNSDLIDKTNSDLIDKKLPEITSEPVTDFKPNKKPLEDFVDEILEKRADKQSKQSNLDLTKSFKVKGLGVLTEDGKLDPKKSGFLKLKDEEEGDKEMVDIAKSAIEAIGASGLFYYLKSLGVDKVDFTLIQDDKQIYAVISSFQKDEIRAKTISSGFNNLLSIAKLTVKEDELKTLLNSVKVEPQGKNFVLNFNIDKPTAQKMIEKKLQEIEAKKKEAQARP